jgi:hypothetical protein
MQGIFHNFFCNFSDIKVLTVEGKTGVLNTVHELNATCKFDSKPIVTFTVLDMKYN